MLQCKSMMAGSHTEVISYGFNTTLWILLWLLYCSLIKGGKCMGMLQHDCLAGVITRTFDRKPHNAQPCMASLHSCLPIK